MEGLIQQLIQNAEPAKPRTPLSWQCKNCLCTAMLYTPCNFNGLQTMAVATKPLQVFTFIIMRLILLLIFLAGGGRLFAQERFPAGCNPLQEAIRALCGKDTAGAIRQLDQLNRSYPDTGLAAQGYLEAGRIYLAGNKKEEARYCFEAGLKTPKRECCGYWRNDSCSSTAGYYPYEFKAAICIELSKMAAEEGKPALALQYLLLTDSVHFPYTGCGNGDDIQHGLLSVYVAHGYVINGDTTSAIHRLLNNLPEYYKVAPALVPLLQRKFTRSYINKEIMEAATRKKPSGEHWMTIRMFGRDLQWRPLSDEILQLKLMTLYQWPEQSVPVEECTFHHQLVETLHQKDTLAAARLIDDFISQTGDDSLSTDASFRAGQVYYALKRKEEAKRILLSGVNNKWKLQCWITDHEAASPYVARAGMYQLLHQIAVEENELPLALQYLLKADQEFINYKEAGPGIAFYRGCISKPLIDLYARIGDTSKAIQRGVEHMMQLFCHADDALRDLLLARYTAKQIDAEFRRAINAVKQVGNIAHTTVFGFIVQWKLNSKNLKKAKEELLDHYRLAYFLE